LGEFAQEEAMQVHYPHVEVCWYCGSPLIQWTGWYEANTDELVDGDGPADHGYCPTCSAAGEEGEISKSCSFDLADPARTCQRCYHSNGNHTAPLLDFAVEDFLSMTRRLIYEFTDVEYTTD
jgi:hypothetical protein